MLRSINRGACASCGEATFRQPDSNDLPHSSFSLARDRPEYDCLVHSFEVLSFEQQNLGPELEFSLLARCQQPRFPSASAPWKKRCIHIQFPVPKI